MTTVGEAIEKYKMRYFTRMHPGEYGQTVRETWSEDKILAYYYPTWRSKCLIAGVGVENLTEAACLDDWITVNWALETDELGRPIEHDVAKGKINGD